MTEMLILVDPIIAYPGETITIAATLNLNSPPPLTIPFQLLEFSIGGTIIGTATTDADGLGTIQYLVDKRDGSYTLNVKYLGDGIYNTTNSSTILEVSTDMAHYGDSEAVALRVKSLNAKDLDPSLIEEGLTSADEIINNTVPGAPFKSPFPPAITRAANYYAAMDIIDILYTNNANRNPVAVGYESRAQKVLAPFM